MSVLLSAVKSRRYPFGQFNFLHAMIDAIPLLFSSCESFAPEILFLGLAIIVRIHFFVVSVPFL